MGPPVVIKKIDVEYAMSNLLIFDQGLMSIALEFEDNDISVYERIELFKQGQKPDHIRIWNQELSTLTIVR